MAASSPPDEAPAVGLDEAAVEETDDCGPFEDEVAEAVDDESGVETEVVDEAVDAPSYVTLGTLSCG